MYGERIRALRKEKGMTLRELSKELGISFTALGNYEREERQPSFKLIEDIASFFGVSFEYLTGRTDNRGQTRDDILFQKDFNELAKLIEDAPPEVKKAAVDIYSHIYLLTKKDIQQQNVREMEILFKILHFILNMRNGFIMSEYYTAYKKDMDSNGFASIFFKEKQKLDELIFELFEINSSKQNDDPFNNL